MIKIKGRDKYSLFGTCEKCGKQYYLENFPSYELMEQYRIMLLGFIAFNRPRKKCLRAFNGVLCDGTIRDFSCIPSYVKGGVIDARA